MISLMDINRRNFIKQTALCSLGFITAPLCPLICANTYAAEESTSDKMMDKTFIDNHIMKWKDAQASFNQKIFLYPAKHFSRKKGELLQCNLCPNNCIIKENQRGACLTRINKNGNMFSNCYGRVEAVVRPGSHLELPITYLPLEKRYISVGLVGCGLRCSFCFVGHIVQRDPETLAVDYQSPGDIVQMAITNQCPSLVLTFNEPTNNFEFSLATAQKAQENNIKVLLTTCGYVNQEPFKELATYLDGVAIGLKGFNEKLYQKYTKGSLNPILGNMLLLKKMGVPVEIHYLVIPTVSDKVEDLKEMGRWVKNNLGEYTPLHLIRFRPAFKLNNLPQTSISSLKHIKGVLTETGLKFVNLYLGATRGGLSSFYECQDCYDVTCPNCGNMVLECKIIDSRLLAYTFLEKNWQCSHCGFQLPGIPPIMEPDRFS